MRISKSSVNKAAPRARTYTLWDSSLSGFGLKIHPSGRKVYVLKYRVGGGRKARRREPVLGVHGAITPDQARTMASAWIAQVAHGKDPAADREKMRNAPTMSELFHRYLTDYARPKKKQSSVRNDERILEKTLLPALGQMKVLDVGRNDVERLHRSMQSRPYQANRTVALLSKTFNLAERWGIRPDGTNPCRHIEKYKEKKRERYLSAHEFQRLGAALATAESEPLLRSNGHPTVINPSAIAAIRLLLFTGARCGEILGMKWDWINWQKCRAELPDSKTGRKFVYMPAPAMELLRVLHRQSNDWEYVIRGRYPDRPFVNIKDPWRLIRIEADLEDVRIHDLRHAFASVGVSEGLSLPVIGTLLGHRSVATTQRYAHLSDDPVRSAADQIGLLVESAMKQ